MTYLLDTCVISELASRQPESNVVQWIDSVDPEQIFLSVVTLGEIQKGIEKVREPKRREALGRWLHNELMVRFRDRLIVLDGPILLAWGSLSAKLESKGRPMPAMDSLIAATALHHGLVLVTRNEKDFLHAAVNLFNPWSLENSKVE